MPTSIRTTAHGRLRRLGHRFHIQPRHARRHADLHTERDTRRRCCCPVSVAARIGCANTRCPSDVSVRPPRLAQRLRRQDDPMRVRLPYVFVSGFLAGQSRPPGQPQEVCCAWLQPSAADDSLKTQISSDRKRWSYAVRKSVLVLDGEGVEKAQKRRRALVCIAALHACMCACMRSCTHTNTHVCSCVCMGIRPKSCWHWHMYAFADTRRGPCSGTALTVAALRLLCRP